MPEIQQTADGDWARAAECLQRLERIAYSDQSLSTIATQLCQAFAEFVEASEIATGGQAASLWVHSERPDQTTDRSVCLGSSDQRDSWPTEPSSHPATFCAGFNLHPLSTNEANQPKCRLELQTYRTTADEFAAGSSITDQVSRELAQSILKLAAYAYLRDVFTTQISAGESAAIVASEDLPAAARSIAQTIARVCNVDRVSVLHVQRESIRLIAASTTDSIDARSGHAISLQKLVRETANATTQAAVDLLRQSHEAAAGCNALIDVATTVSTSNEVKAGDEDETLAIVLENFDRADDDHVASADSLSDRYRMTRPWLSKISAAAILQHQLRHNTIGRRITKSIASRRLLVTAASLLVAWCVLSFVQVDFVLTANGRVLPRHRANVFVPADSVVTGVLVKDGDQVDPGQTLVTLESPSLRLIHEEIVGKLDTAKTRLGGLQTERSSTNRSREMSSRNSLDEQIAKTEIQSLELQLQTVQQQIDSLKLTASISGIVSGWDLQTALPGKPVDAGEWLFCIDQRQSDWIAEIQLPDQHSGHLNAVAADQPLSAKIRVLSRPDIALGATFLSASASSLRLPDGSGVIPLTLQIEKPESFELPVGASVAADLNFGRRSLGFVCFRSIIQWYQRQAWF